jgi:RNA polymerase sigma factor (sigma-70 family)
VSTPFRQPRSLPRRAAWPERIAHLALVRKSSADPAERDEALSEIWVIVNAVLIRYARQHARSSQGLSEEDLAEVASAKALALFGKMSAGSWDPSASSPGQTSVFLSTLARNGLVDHLRARPKRVLVPYEETVPESGIPVRTREGEESPERAAERAQFTRALCACLSRLTPRARRVWLFRACLELSGREIARHPEVRMSAAAVGVALARCRQLLSSCLHSGGFAWRDLPPGTFTALWETVSSELEGRE